MQVPILGPFFLLKRLIDLFAPVSFLIATIIAMQLFGIPINALAQNVDLARNMVVNKWQQKALDKKLYERKEWRRLLHYHKTYGGKWISQVDGKKFYVHPRGKYSPRNELLALIENIFKSQKEPNKHPLCQFPARTKWLKKELSIPKHSLPQVTCIYYDNFQKEHQVQSVSLIFSSYYLNSPASAFGHTLLRLRKNSSKLKGKHFELLDVGVNFGAVVDTNNPLVYAIKGLTGGFRGTFSSIPYYYKIREYNDYESRDLFSYELNLTPEEIKRLTDHIFELLFTHFDYYYMTENCSYHMLTILEAAKPELNLTKKLPYIVIPIDTVKALYSQPGLVKEVLYRPAKRKIFKKRYNELSHAEKNWLKIAAINKEPPQFPPQATLKNKARVLDAYIDYLDFKNPKAILLKEKHKLKDQILLKRSEVTIPDDFTPPKVDERQWPHKGHASRRIQLSVGEHKDHDLFYDLEYRTTFHDILDSGLGMPEPLELEFLQANIRYFHHRKKILVEEIKLFHIRSHTTFSWYHNDISWEAYLGAQQRQTRFCTECFFPLGRISGGFALKADFLFPAVLYALMDAEVSLSKHFHRTWTRIGVGPHMGIKISPSESLLLNLEGYYHYLPITKHDTKGASYEFRWHYRSDSALGGKFLHTKWHEELKFNWFHYF